MTVYTSVETGLEGGLNRSSQGLTQEIGLPMYRTVRRVPAAGDIRATWIMARGS